MPKGKPENADSWLRFHREERGWTQEQLGGKTKPKLSKVSINHFERGHRRPAPATAERIADALGLEVADVFPQPGVKSPREAARMYAALVRKQRGGQLPDLAPEEEFERDMARADHGREAYYRRQDPRTYQPLELMSEDGRLIREHPPRWFVDEVRNARKGKA